ncbi:unnamed protein product [Paramecium pentaurelia]|uniref:Uncharacterized protein n=1 Tax=Paramecium pentaurelia TaxID=43138 RepID=A0A8S1UZ62_9CILI|nr:unnamed protein product [Paramecium pentaurelia]
MQKFEKERYFHKSPEQIRREKLDMKMQNVKDDQQNGVIKYFMKHKSSDQLQSPVHNVQYYSNKDKPKMILYRTLQKVQVEPEVKIDEVKELRWRVLSKNCQNLLELSRVALDKLSDFKFVSPTPQSSMPTSNPKVKFLSKRHSIELRLGDIITPPPSQPKPVPKILQDPFYAKFKKFYEKIGLQVKEPNKYNLNQDDRQTFQSSEKQTHKKHRSLHVSPQQSSLNFCQKKPKNAYFLQELLKVSSNAYRFQVNLKKDQSENIEETSQKLNNIQSEFDKFHKLLNQSDSF